MFNAIYCEFFKLRKSHFYSSIILITCFMPLTLLLGWALQGHYVVWHGYIFQIEQLTFMFLTVPLSTLITSYIFSREFSYKTMPSLFCYPINKAKIFLSKLITAAILIAVTIFFQLFLTILCGFFLNHEQFTSEILFIHLKINLYHVLSLYAILPIAIFITLLCKNMIIPLIYAFVISVSNMFIWSGASARHLYSMGLFFKSACNYIPTYHPLLSLTNCIKQSKGNEHTISTSFPLSSSSIIVDLLVFAVVLSLCVLYYYKSDVK